MKNELIKILDEFLNKNIFFSNEREFQFHLAKEIEKLSNVEKILFEVPSFDREWPEIKNNLDLIKRKNKEYTDLVVKIRDSDEFIAIELKYKTATKAHVYNKTNFDVLTMAQGAYDIGAYSFIKDVFRLKNLIMKKRYCINNLNIVKCFSILLTNEIKYRTNNLTGGQQIWKDFSIAEQTRQITPKKYCVKSHSEKYNSYPELDLTDLNHPIDLEWHPSKSAGEQLNRFDFNYLIVEI